jgi:hypothetical protein
VPTTNSTALSFSARWGVANVFVLETAKQYRVLCCQVANSAVSQLVFRRRNTTYLHIVDDEGIVCGPNFVRSTTTFDCNRHYLLQCSSSSVAQIVIQAHTFAHDHRCYRSTINRSFPKFLYRGQSVPLRSFLSASIFTPRLGSPPEAGRPPWHRLDRRNEAAE